MLMIDMYRCVARVEAEGEVEERRVKVRETWAREVTAAPTSMTTSPTKTLRIMCLVRVNDGP